MESPDHPTDTPPEPANDNDDVAVRALDNHIWNIARAIGRHIAREQTQPKPAANDNENGLGA